MAPPGASPLADARGGPLSGCLAARSKLKAQHWAWASSRGPHDGQLLEPVIALFWAIRAGLEIYAESTGSEEYKDPDTGKTIRVQREYEAVSPLNSVYTAFFSNEFKDTDLTGLNCHVPDWRVPGTAAAAKRKELDDLLIDL